MSKQLVEEWFKARPTVMVSFKDSSFTYVGDEVVEVKVKFVYETNFWNGSYEWGYDFDLMDRTDARENFMESISEYVQDTLNVDREEYGYPQVFQMVLNERGGLK
jgi:hypothetical protein